MLAQGLARLVTALHRIVQLLLQLHDFLAQLLDSSIKLIDRGFTGLYSLVEIGHGALIIFNASIALLNDPFELSNLCEEFFFALLAGSTHVLLLRLDLSEQLVDPCLQFTARLLFLLVFCDAELVHFLPVISFECTLLACKFTLHAGALLLVRLRHLGDRGLVLGL